MIEVVGFDLDNTLYDHSTFEFQVYEEIASRLNHLYNTDKNKYLKSLKFEFNNRNFNKLFDNAYIKAFEILPKDWEEKYIPIILEIYRNYVPNKRIQPKKQILNILKEIKYTTQAKLVLITNGKSKIQNTKIDLLGIRDYFDLILISDEFEPIARKPDTTMFKEVLRYYSIDGNKMVYIGDDNFIDGSCIMEKIHFFNVSSLKDYIDIRIIMNQLFMNSEEYHENG